jgi:hypothetical protein
MDDLSRIEGSYGSVAEYNRVKEEEANERWWNSLPKSQQNWYEIESEYQSRMHDEITEKLSIPATDHAKEVVADFKEKAGELNWRNYNDERKGNKMKHEAMQNIADTYGLKFNDAVPEVGQGQFYITYDYIEGGQYHYKFSDPMDKDTFMNAYSDLYALDKGMTVRYRDISGREPDRWGVEQDMHYISNSSLASIRSTDFRHWGVEDPEGDRIIKDTKAKYKEIVDKAKSDFNREHTAEIEFEKQNRGYEFDDIHY